VQKSVGYYKIINTPHTWPGLAAPKHKKYQPHGAWTDVDWVDN